MHKPQGTVNRFVVIRFMDGWAVWDNLWGVVQDGVYYDYDLAVSQANGANEDPTGWQRHWYEEGTRFETMPYEPLPSDTKPAPKHRRR